VSRCIIHRKHLRKDSETLDFKETKHKIKESEVRDSETLYLKEAKHEIKE